MAVILAMVCGGAAVAASLTRLRHLRGAVSFDLDALRGALGQTANRATLFDLATALQGEGDSWEAELVSSLVEAATLEARTAAVNESLHDVARLLDWGAQIDKAAPRAAAAGTMGTLFWSVARQTLTVSDVLPVIAWGFCGFTTSLLLAREAKRTAMRHRQRIDVWVDRMLKAAEKP